jgi:hypothetical protein
MLFNQVIKITIIVAAIKQFIIISVIHYNSSFNLINYQ